MIRDLLRTPDSQGDPYEWSATLLAHAFIGVALVGVMPWWLAVAGYAVWEIVQWRRYDADPWDCLLDLVAVTAGVCVGWAYLNGGVPVGALLALLVILIVGTRKRA